MKTHGSVATVIAAIQDEVQIESERLEAQTAADLARLQREFESHPPVIADREARLAVAHAQARERLAREDYRDARAEIEVREAWIGKVITAGRNRLAQMAGPCRRALLGRLADEALVKIHSRECVLQVGRDDLELADEAWLDERASNTGKTALNVAGIAIEGGCIAVSADGRVAFDNSLAARTERFEEKWRAALAALFEEARR
jgi:vacuolar-type H+-ATPase subunit E/Vma4